MTVRDGLCLGILLPIVALCERVMFDTLYLIVYDSAGFGEGLALLYTFGYKTVISDWFKVISVRGQNAMDERLNSVFSHFEGKEEETTKQVLELLSENEIGKEFFFT